MKREKLKETKKKVYLTSTKKGELNFVEKTFCNEKESWGRIHDTSISSKAK